MASSGGSGKHPAVLFLCCAVLVFVEGAIPALKNEASFSYEERAPKLEDVPKEFQHTLGSISVNKSITALNKFLQKYEFIKNKKQSNMNCFISITYKKSIDFCLFEFYIHLQPIWLYL